MSTNKIDNFAQIVKDMLNDCGTGYNGMPIATMKSYLPKLTAIFNCNKNKEWRKVCFDMDNQNAQKYLKLKPKELIAYNGMSLKDWDEEDITRKDVLVALDSAWHKLTPMTVRKNKKIRKHLTNKDIIKLAMSQLYYVHDFQHKCKELINPLWLECLDPGKDHPFKHLKSIKEWRDYLGIVHWFVERNEYKDYTKRIDLLKKLQAPSIVIQYALDLSNFTARYKLANPETDYTKKTTVALSTDDNENAEFEVYLKMKGVEWHKHWSNWLAHEQHYQECLFALNECLIAKYDKQEKENII